MLQIKNHILNLDNKPVQYKQTPNVSGKLLEIKYIVVHWTGGISHVNAMIWLTNPAAKTSAQLILGRAGELTQLCPLDLTAWHVGPSEYQGHTSLNKYSIGLECVSRGLCVQGPNTVEIHGKHYERFTDQQHNILKELCKVLKQTYPSIKEVVSHKDLAMPRGRKQDCPDVLYNKELLNKVINET